MAKKKKKINNEVLSPKYRVLEMKDRMDFFLGGGSYFAFAPGVQKYIYVEYKNNKLNMVYDVPDYTHINSEEELFQYECTCNIPMNFRELVQIQKSIHHHFNQYLYPSKRELCNLKTNYIIDTSYALDFNIG